MRWVSRVYTEFHRQGRAEREANYTLSPGMGEEDSVAKGQVFFGTVICRPLFVLLADVLPETQPILAQLHANLETWKSFAAFESEQVKDAAS